MSPCTGSLLRVLEVHDRIDERFEIHRDRLVELRFGDALEALGDFERDLVRHMTQEEELILPLYRERVGTVTGGDPELFLLEHANLLRNLASLKEDLAKLASQPGAGVREAHRFLDREHLFLHLMQHHGLRERNLLYPLLDARLDEGEREALLRTCLWEREV